MGRSIFGGEPVPPLPAAIAQVSLPARPGVPAAAVPGPRAHAGGAVPPDDGFCRGRLVQVWFGLVWFELV